jgi:hypothetical protein
VSLASSRRPSIAVPTPRCYRRCTENSSIYTIFLNKKYYLLFIVAHQIASSRTRSDPESPLDDDREGLPPDADDSDRDRPEALIELLANARRRYLWEHLRREGGEVSLREASRAIAGRELDKPPSAVTYDERKSVYTSLLQFHCPKMADAGLVEFDRRAASVAPREGVDLVVELEPDRRRVATTVLGAVGLSTLITAAAWRLGLPVFGALSVEGLAVSLGVAAAIACAVYCSVVRSASAVGFDEVLRRLR